MTERILAIALARLAQGGLDGLSLDDLAASLGTSKQALYRRHTSKQALALASLDWAIGAFSPPPPDRSNPARDLSLLLKACWSEVFSANLGKALVRTRHAPGFSERAAVLEQDLQFHIRQILVATPFEQDMDLKARLLVALLWQEAAKPSREAGSFEDVLDKAILLVLGLGN
ncbi:TetR/AcrR family transcriptional regulator [Roseibium sediminis]|uniref:TetR/AcrR family transcriptional regulator n=1 Tax=Roseibium sediminis TaxID=1775174 RepID=UPI0013764913|nr:TetR/AcrR family transcriptional regulator [Roseibium sediminis]